MALLAPAAVAHAEPSAAERETARQLMEQGRDRLDQKNYKAALDAFKAADDLMHVPSTAFQVGNAQVELGLLVEARDTFSRIVRSPQAPSESAPFMRAREAATKLYEELEQRIPALRFVVNGATGDVSLTVDDTAVSPAVQKFPFKLNPGHHVVIAKLGTATAKQEVDVREHETKDVVLDLPAQSGSPAPPQERGEARPPTRGVSTLTYVGFGVAGVGLVAGTITGILMFSKKSTLDGECSADKKCPPNGDLSAAYTMATVSTISFIVAGVGAGVGVYGLLSGRSRSSATATHIEPWAGIGAGGLRGAF